MPRTIKIKKTPRKNGILKDAVAGYILVPLDQGKSHYPRVQSNVLEGTYYRVNESTGKCNAFVTVMPDKHRVAWDTCSKCHTHVSVCKCSAGIYHPASIAFIRATCDHDDWPTVRIMDYSEYFDPYMRNSKTPVERETNSIVHTAPKKPTIRSGKEPTRRHVAKVAAAAAITESEAFGLTAAEIENIDMATVNKQAEKSARNVVGKVRAKIKRRRSK